MCSMPIVLQSGKDHRGLLDIPYKLVFCQVLRHASFSGLLTPALKVRLHHVYKVAALSLAAQEFLILYNFP